MSGSTPGPDPALAEERRLIDRARRGDSAAFRLLVQAYSARAYALALRVVRSPEEAEEVAQDAFVRAWRALPRFRGESRFSTWLYRIVTRRALDAAAASRQRTGRERELDGMEERLVGDDPREAGVGSAGALETLIGRLPRMQRAAITLYYYEDRSVGEVAAALGLPVGTVKTHLHRARRTLRRAWMRERGESR